MVSETAIIHAFLTHRPEYRCKSGVMIDVGCHQGSSMLPFLESGWKVFAFEPDTRNRMHLKPLTDQYPNLHIDQRAVSNQTAYQEPFFYSNVSTGISSLRTFHSSHEFGECVDVTTLEDFCLENIIEQVDFLKVDTEGHDLFVLQGFPWNRIQPEIVECEFEDHKTLNLGYSHSDLANFLIEMGYFVLMSEWEAIVEYGGQHEWRCLQEWPCILNDPAGWGNFLAFRNKPNQYDLMSAIGRGLVSTCKENVAKRDKIINNRNQTISELTRKNDKLATGLSTILSINDCIKRVNGKAQDMRNPEIASVVNYDFALRMNRLIAATRVLGEKYSKIAIYGYGLIGKLVAAELGKRVSVIVDQSPQEGSVTDTPVALPHLLLDYRFDCVLITVLGREQEISSYLQNTLNVHPDKIIAFNLANLDSDSWGLPVLNKTNPSTDYREYFRTKTQPLTMADLDGIPPLFTNDPLLPREDQKRLLDLHNKFAGNRMFIMGNGPSLNRLSLDLLKHEYTFGVNRIYLLFDRISWRPSFYSAFDLRVVPDNAEEINMLDIPFKFFATKHCGIIEERSNHLWYLDNSRKDGLDNRFEPSAVITGFGGGGSITHLAIQLAFFMGFDPIYLIGVDADYMIQDTVIQSGPDKFGDGILLHLESTRDDDINHFDPRYFGAGKKWHNPNVPLMIEGYKDCKKAIEDRGRKIFNATAGGKLEVFERVRFEELF